MTACSSIHDSPKVNLMRLATILLIVVILMLMGRI